ncbi:MAG: hypothetical protein GYA59_01635 [Chloroflexi bacterium]|nr:hypothetical protein [Chloroflexota bacterium]
MEKTEKLWKNWGEAGEVILKIQTAGFLPCGEIRRFVLEKKRSRMPAESSPTDAFLSTNPGG